MRRHLIVTIAAALLAVGCGGNTSSGGGSRSPTPDEPAVTSSPSPTPAGQPSTTDLGAGLPIDDDWEVGVLALDVLPAAGDVPARGPASPDQPLVPDRLPDDGVYAVAATRGDGWPGTLRLTVRRWVACAAVPSTCPPDALDDGIVADQGGAVGLDVPVDDLTVVVRPLQRFEDGRLPDPPTVVTGSGRAFDELLSGWCDEAAAPSPATNCGLDPAVQDWILAPTTTTARDPADRLVDGLARRGTDPAFPFGAFDDGSSDTPCGPDRSCPLAYRGPAGTHLVIDLASAAADEEWQLRLYGWWTSLEVRDGRPVLHVDAGQVAG